MPTLANFTLIEQHFLLLPTVLIVKRTTEIYCDYYWLYANSQWTSLFLDLFMTETLFSRMLRNLNWPRVSSNNVSHLGFLRVYCVYKVFLPLDLTFRTKSVSNLNIEIGYTALSLRHNLFLHFMFLFSRFFRVSFIRIKIITVCLQFNDSSTTYLTLILENMRFHWCR